MFPQIRSINQIDGLPARAKHQKEDFGEVPAQGQLLKSPGERRKHPSVYTIRINEPKVIQDTIEGESVIVNLATGNYFSVDKVGAEIWQNIEQGKSIGEIFEIIFSEYDGDKDKIRITVDGFFDELIKEDLVVKRSEQPGGSVGNENKKTAIEQGQKKVFEAPNLKKYTDVQDLLLLDPIHESDRQVAQYEDGLGSITKLVIKR